MAGPLQPLDVFRSEKKGDQHLLSLPPYPSYRLARAWHHTLLCQFHDVLPGSCIRKVAEESEALLAGAQAEALTITHEGLQKLGALLLRKKTGSPVPDEDQSEEKKPTAIALWNSCSADRHEVVALPARPRSSSVLGLQVSQTNERETSLDVIDFIPVLPTLQHLPKAHPGGDCWLAEVQVPAYGLVVLPLASDDEEERKSKESSSGDMVVTSPTSVRSRCLPARIHSSDSRIDAPNRLTSSDSAVRGDTRVTVM